MESQLNTEPINKKTRTLIINKIISFTNVSDVIIFQDYDKGLINKKLILLNRRLKHQIVAQMLLLRQKNLRIDHLLIVPRSLGEQIGMIVQN